MFVVIIRDEGVGTEGVKGWIGNGENERSPGPLERTDEPIRGTGPLHSHSLSMLPSPEAED
jgi:hypothetical protein